MAGTEYLASALRHLHVEGLISNSKALYSSMVLLYDNIGRSIGVVPLPRTTDCCALGVCVCVCDTVPSFLCFGVIPDSVISNRLVQQDEEQPGRRASRVSTRGP